MPSYIRDLMVRNVVLDDDAIQELNATILRRVNALNSSTQDPERQLSQIYVVRFDGRGYRTFSVDEAWSYYKSATRVERVILQAESRTGLNTNHMFGEQIEVRLDTDSQGSSHILVGGDSKDWVETTFSELETVVRRSRSLPTAIIRTQWTALVLQLLGVFAGVLLCLWLATATAPFLKDVEYPRALAFAFWFLVYSNLWTYLQQQAMRGIGMLFLSVRFSRKGEHWGLAIFRKAIEATGVAFALWVLAWLSKWALAVIAPFLVLSP